MSIISRQQVLPEHGRVWEQTIVEEAYQQALVELLEQGHVVISSLKQKNPSFKVSNYLS
ncbi:hypothetical protein VCHA49P379_90007 [Vibrio chagasii]|nr:hypothetical protein VCHA40P240_10197 [Vibrio chagasii]CAH7420064.1 hypothetical protein VCHA49P379_90007 [Vibrio chagasii]CAH7485397.1 hypothetical protein VCHA38O210_90006 [Vibrio chagasii]